MGKTNLEGLVRDPSVLERFRAFERDVDQALMRETEERRRAAEGAKRAKEKKAKKKRIKAAAAAS